MPRGTSRYDEAALQQRLWTPKNSDFAIGGWWDVADLSTLTHTGSGISEWRDKSGNAYHGTQSTDADRPRFNPLAFGERAGLTWDSSDGLSSALSASSGSESVFCVGQTPGGTINTIIGAFNGSGGRQFRVEANNQLGFVRQGVAGTSSGTGNTIPLDTPILIGLTYDSSTVTFYSQGQILGSPISFSPSLTAGRTSYLGRQQLGLEGWDGTLAEIIVIQSVVPDDIREKIEGYLAWKWEFQNSLAAGHRYVSRPPTIGD
jgi:hypothetical protein